MSENPANAGRKQGDTRFRPGRSGNPRGKTPGTRHAATRLGEKLLADGIEAVATAVLDAAKGGDMAAARIVMERLVPVRKGAAIRFAVPPITTAAMASNSKPTSAVGSPTVRRLKFISPARPANSPLIA